MNHTDVLALTTRGKPGAPDYKITGAKVKDAFTGEVYEIRAKQVLRSAPRWRHRCQHRFPYLSLRTCTPRPPARRRARPRASWQVINATGPFADFVRKMAQPGVPPPPHPPPRPARPARLVRTGPPLCAHAPPPPAFRTPCPPPPTVTRRACTPRQVPEIIVPAKGSHLVVPDHFSPDAMGCVWCAPAPPGPPPDHTPEHRTPGPASGPAREGGSECRVGTRVGATVRGGGRGWTAAAHPRRRTSAPRTPHRARRGGGQVHQGRACALPSPLGGLHYRGHHGQPPPPPPSY